jgi:hypothetical protein
MRNLSVYKAIILYKRNYVLSNETELTWPHVQCSGQQIFNFFHQTFHVPASELAARFVGKYKSHLSRKLLKNCKFIVLTVLSNSVQLILVTGLSVTNKTTH